MVLEMSPPKQKSGEERKSAEVTNNIVESKKGQNVRQKSNSRKKNMRKVQVQKMKPKTTCAIDELKGHIFDCTGYRQAEDYKSAKIALENYISKECTNGTDARISISELKPFEFEMDELIPIDDDDPEIVRDTKKRMNHRIG